MPFPIISADNINVTDKTEMLLNVPIIGRDIHSNKSQVKMLMAMKLKFITKTSTFKTDGVKIYQEILGLMQFRQEHQI